MAINEIYNPSFEVDLANTTIEDNLSGGTVTLTRTTNEFYIDSASAELDIPASANETEEWKAKLVINNTNLPSIVSGKRYVVSLYAKASVAHNQFSAEFTGAGSYYPGNKSLTTSWARYDWTFTASQSGDLSVKFLANNGSAVTIHVDGIMFEQLDTGGPSTYFDGDTAGYEWEGTAHNSRSGDSFVSGGGTLEVNLGGTFTVKPVLIHDGSSFVSATKQHGGW